MAQWLSFSLVVSVLTVVLLALARQSQSMLRATESAADDEQPEQLAQPEGGQPEPNGTDSERVTPGASPPDSGSVDPEPAAATPDEPPGLELTPAALLANVALSQGLVAVIVVAAAWYFAIPAEALGAISDSLGGGLTAVALGAAFGLALWVGNELSTTVADAAGASYDEGVRERLAPDSPAGWAVLFLAVLPLIAVSEELLFRAALIGVPAAGFEISPWPLAVVSSLAFAFGHGAQGRVGIVVTGVLGFVLAAGYVLSGSLLVVVVAHYVINALEFLLHELLGIEGLFASVTRLSAGSGPRE